MQMSTFKRSSTAVRLAIAIGRGCIAFMVRLGVCALRAMLDTGVRSPCVLTALGGHKEARSRSRGSHHWRHEVQYLLLIRTNHKRFVAWHGGCWEEGENATVWILSRQKWWYEYWRTNGDGRNVFASIPTLWTVLLKPHCLNGNFSCPQESIQGSYRFHYLHRKQGCIRDLRIGKAEECNLTIGCIRNENTL